MHSGFYAELKILYKCTTELINVKKTGKNNSILNAL